MTFGDDIKRKADEAQLPAKAKNLGDAAADLVAAAVGMFGGFAAEHREKVEGALDRAQDKVEENVGERSVEKVTRVRESIDKGLNKLIDHHDQTVARPSEQPAAAPRPGGEWPSAPVPDDVHSAFDDDNHERSDRDDGNDDAHDSSDEAPAGSPS